MSDTQKCFAYLKENIPLWIKDLQAVEKTIEVRHNEVSRIPVPAQPVQKRTGSNESIRLDNDAPTTQPPTVEITSAPQLDAISPSPMSLTQQLNLAKRKRKTASLMTGNLSNPVKYRSRAMIVVYYDSEVQKSFETLVRNIGTGRNLLRKGKMAARMEAFATGLDDDNDPLQALGKAELPELPPKLNMRSFGAARHRTAANTLAAGTDTYDAADKELEKAQSLCERGAHQFLRDGDCRLETHQATERFQEVLRISEREAARLQQKEAKTEKETSSTLTVTTSKPSAPAINLPPAISPSISKAQATMEIEVDDDNEGDEPDFAIPTFRRMARQRN